MWVGVNGVITSNASRWVGVTGVLSKEFNASKWVGDIARWVGCLIEFTWRTMFQWGWEFNGVITSNASK